MGATIRGDTYLYGRVVHVDETERTVCLELDTGETVSCEVSQELARELNTRINDSVGLRGEATWRATDWSVQAFQALELLPWVPTPITEAIQRLAEASGPDAWTDEMLEREEDDL